MIKVGQKVYVLPSSLHSKHRELKEGVVTKVGRIYFTVLYDSRLSKYFYLTTLCESCDHNYPAKVYLSTDDYNNEIERHQLIKDIEAFIRKPDFRNSSMKCLREIKKIIDKKDDNGSKC